MKTKRKQFEHFTEINSGDLMKIHGGMEGTIWEILKVLAHEYFSKESSSPLI
jgi:hypothetical protein